MEETELKNKPSPEQSKYMNRVFTVPNLLTFIRILLIPAILLTYFLLNKEPLVPAILLGVSALTDIADGFIARKFNMISHVGRILDPIADKLTQLAVMACLCFTFPIIVIPAILLVVKEIASGVVALMSVIKTHNTINSEWHGKLTTVLIYITMFVHIIFKDLPFGWSLGLIIACATMICVSCGLYLKRFLGIIAEQNKEDNKNNSINNDDNSEKKEEKAD